jgi:hypothetical protein
MACLSRRKVAQDMGVKIEKLCRDQKRAPGLARRMFLRVRFSGGRSYVVWIWYAPSLSVPVPQSVLEISWSKPQWDTQGLCGDGRQKVGSVNPPLSEPEAGGRVDLQAVGLRAGGQPINM